MTTSFGDSRKTLEEDSSGKLPCSRTRPLPQLFPQHFIYETHKTYMHTYTIYCWNTASCEGKRNSQNYTVSKKKGEREKKVIHGNGARLLLSKEPWHCTSWYPSTLLITRWNRGEWGWMAETQLQEKSIPRCVCSRNHTSWLLVYNYLLDAAVHCLVAKLNISLISNYLLVLLVLIQRYRNCVLLRLFYVTRAKA